MVDKIEDKKVIQSQSDLVKSVSDLKADSLAKEKLDVATPLNKIDAASKWKFWSRGKKLDGNHVILEMRGELTKNILQYLAGVQATVVQNDEANLSCSIRVPQEKLEQVNSFLREQNTTPKS